MKIVVLDAYRANPGDLSWDGIAAFGELTVYDRTAAEDIIPRIADNDIVIVNKTPISRRTIEACPSIKMITLFATGYNVIDVEAAREHGIPVCNVPSYSTDAVAQLTTALLLEIASQVGRHNEACHRGEWNKCKDFSFTVSPLIELAGKTVGILGYGQIGRAFAKICRAMGMRVLCHSRHRTEPDGVADWVELDALLAQSDILSLHCPLNRESTGIINKQTLDRMKPGAILLNTARGGLLNEADVAQALKEGKLYALGADVVSVEPIEDTNPLLTAPNVYLTPHIAWSPHETRVRLFGIVEDNIRQFVAGHPINVVN